MISTDDSTFSEGTCPSTTLSTTDHNGMVSRDFLRSETNRLSQGTTYEHEYQLCKYKCRVWSPVCNPIPLLHNDM
jgi:hypothetical protein